MVGGRHMDVHWKLSQLHCTFENWHDKLVMKNKIVALTRLLVRHEVSLLQLDKPNRLVLVSGLKNQRLRKTGWSDALVGEKRLLLCLVCSPLCPHPQVARTKGV